MLQVQLFIESNYISWTKNIFSLNFRASNMLHPEHRIIIDRKLHWYCKDAFLIGDDEDVVGAELQRREARKAKAESAEQRKKKTAKDKVEKEIQGEHDPDDTMVEFDKSSKWKEQHMIIAETRFQAYNIFKS